MTEQRNDRKLETLYREAGDVEPDAGLDRIIRARADEAAGRARSPSRIPWLGGLVTASVAIVAIAVVLQQTPPVRQPPEAFSPEESGEPKAFMAPSMGTQSPENVSADADRAAAESLEEEISPPAGAPLPARNSLPEAPSESRQRRAASPEPEPSAPSAGQDDPAMDRIIVTGARIADPEQAALESRDALIEKLRELIHAGRLDEARGLRDAAADMDTEDELPEDIEQALDRTDSERAPSEPNPDPGAERGSRDGSGNPTTSEE